MGMVVVAHVPVLMHSRGRGNIEAREWRGNLHTYPNQMRREMA